MPELLMLASCFPMTRWKLILRRDSLVRTTDPEVETNRLKIWSEICSTQATELSWLAYSTNTRCRFDWRGLPDLKWAMAAPNRPRTIKTNPNPERKVCICLTLASDYNIISHFHKIIFFIRRDAHGRPNSRRKNRRDGCPDGLSDVP